jgi:hypothetical protein
LLLLLLLVVPAATLAPSSKRNPSTLEALLPK